MTTKINIDPMIQNPLESTLNPISSTNSAYSMYNFQNMMQMQVLNKVMSNLSFIQTGVPMIDLVISTIMQALIISFVTLLVTQIGTFINFIKAKASIAYFYISLYMPKLYYFICCKKRRKMIFRVVDIPYISDTRQINELYKAVFWFLTNNSEIEYLHEPYLQYVFDKKISLESKESLKNNLNLNKILSQKKTKEIEYKNHKITYSLSTELITVYTDKDRKRENFKITISTYVDEIEQSDVLEQFCQNCLLEYIKNFTDKEWVQLIYTNKDGEWKSTPSNNSRKLDTIIFKFGRLV